MTIDCEGPLDEVATSLRMIASDIDAGDYENAKAGETHFQDDYVALL